MGRPVPVLRLYRHGQLSGHAYLRAGRLTVGRDWKCDLIDPEADVMRRPLLSRSRRGCVLRLPEGAAGSVTRGPSTLDLDSLLAWGLARKTSVGIIVPLERDDLARFTIGPSVFTLEFEEPQGKLALQEAAPAGRVPLQYRLNLPGRSDLVFFTLLILISFLQVAGIRSLRNYPIPSVSAIHELPRRIARLILEPTAPPAQVQLGRAAETKAVEEPVPPAPEKPKAEKKEAPPPAGMEKPSPPVTAAAGPGREAIRSQVSKVGVLGVLSGRGTAGRATARGSFSALQLDQELTQDLDQVLTEVGGITVTLPGESDEAGGSGRGDGSGGGLLDIEKAVSASEVGGPVRVSRLEGVPNGVPTGVKGGAEGGTGIEEPLEAAQRDERSSRTIARIVASHIGAIRYAYNRELRKNPGLRGKVVLRFTITPEGQVTECAVEETEMKWPPLENSLVRMALAWQFPPIPEGTVTVTYPLVFFPSM